MQITRLIKRRSVAAEAIEEGFVLVNNKPSKPSTQIKINDVIEIKTDLYHKKAKVIAIPEHKIPKGNTKYIEIIE